MHHFVIAFIVFCCVFGSAVFGLCLRAILPERHLSEESIGVVKLTTGLIATMAALVLGLLISSAKSSLDTVNGELVHNAANVVQLDRVLAKFGPDTQEVRGLLKLTYGMSIQILSSGDPAQLARLGSPEATQRVETFERKLDELSPRTAAQRQLQASAVEIADQVLAARRLTLLQRVGALPMPLLVILVVWLSVIFAAFGMFGSFNWTVLAALFLGALSTSGAIFLILEMNTPLDGLITVSVEPMREALAMLGK
ncbi:hypothetical protein P0D88_07705 [Paraburkholderia sp. RL18-103-BIB-C]|uniref:bestrophin-like domain n=1 Tax=Paraburkholderia sp. RL18-103-BIB-C TaxID=3031637 RepID=UPI0038B77970